MAPKDSPEDDGASDDANLQVRIPLGLVHRVDKLMEVSELGILSRKTFVVQAVIEKLERLEGQLMDRPAFHKYLAELQKSSIAEARKRAGRGRRKD